MKTIEQEALNFAHKKINSIPIEHIKTFPKSFVMAASIDGFNEGIKFAQQWIPVSEELPSFEKKTHDITDSVLLRISDCEGEYFAVGYFSKNINKWKFDFNCKIITDSVTHWRPISFL